MKRKQTNQPNQFKLQDDFHRDAVGIVLRAYRTRKLSFHEGDVLAPALGVVLANYLIGYAVVVISSVEGQKAERQFLSAGFSVLRIKVKPQLAGVRDQIFNFLRAESKRQSSGGGL